MKSIKCILLGYADEVKEFCLWIPTVHKFSITRDMIFEEDKVKVDRGTLDSEIDIFKLKNKTDEEKFLVKQYQSRRNENMLNLRFPRCGSQLEI